MKILKWTKKLSVKVKEIDEQHKKLIELINQAHEFSKDKRKLKKLEKILNELIEFTRVHFSTEEEYFEKCNYSEKEFHMKEHIHLIEVVLHFKAKFDKGEDIMDEFLVFLKEWFEVHLKTTDQEYVKCFQRCDLK